jgi:hypothetical protein
MGYQPAPQALFAQQATAPSPFMLQGDASANPASSVGANQALVQQVQAELAQQDITLSPEEVMSLMPQEATAAISQELAQSTTDLKASLEAQLPKRRTLLQNVVEIGAPMLVGTAVAAATSFLPGANLAIGAAAAAATAGLVNSQIQKGAFTDDYDPNRKVDGFELGVAMATSMIPGGVGSTAAKAVAGKLAVNGLTKGIMLKPGVDLTVRLATQGAITGGITGVGVQTARELHNGEAFTLGTVGRIAGAGIQGAGTGAVFAPVLGRVGTFGKHGAEAGPGNNHIQAGVGETATQFKTVVTSPVTATRWIYNKARSGNTLASPTTASAVAPRQQPLLYLR